MGCRTSWVDAEPAECRRLLAVLTLNLTAVLLQKSLDIAQVCDLLGRKGGRLFVRGNRLRSGFAELGKQEDLRGSCVFSIVAELVRM